MHIAKNAVAVVLAAAATLSLRADAIDGTKVLTGKENFSSLGSSASLGSASNSRLSFYHQSSGTGMVETAFAFDCASASASGDNPAMMVTSADSEFDTCTIFKGAWTGTLNPSVFYFYPNSNPYGRGSDFWWTRAGTFTRDTSLWWFQNDTSDLTVSGGRVYLCNMIWVADSDNAFGPGNNAWEAGFHFLAQTGNRLQGVLTTNGRNLYRASAGDAYFEFRRGGYIGAPVIPVTLIGIATAGYAEVGRIEKPGDWGSEDTGVEMPVWFYAAPGGTVRFTQQLAVYKAHLPIQIVGGGTVVMSSVQSFEASLSTMPFWVRDGRLVVGGADKRYGVGGQDVQVGVRIPKAIEVKAMTQKSIDWYVTSYSDDHKTLALSQACPLDGVAIKAGDRVLLNSPVNSSIYNGVYECVSDTEWRRVEELDESAECVPDTRVVVREGVKYAGTSWYLVDELYRARERLGLPQDAQTFAAENHSVAFFKEDTLNPTTAFLLENSFEATNTIVVVDNGSTEASVLGGYTTDSTPSFTGPMTIERPDVVLTAESGSTVTFAGTMSGCVALKKVGAGTVALTPSDANLTVTNLTVAAGSFKLGANVVLPEKVAEFPFEAGSSVSLELVGDVDLTDWTFDVTGLFKPGKDEELPESFTFAVLSNGAVSGTPTIRLRTEGSAKAYWSVEPAGENVWRVSCRRPGLSIILR